MDELVEMHRVTGASIHTAMNKGEELSYELDCVILFLSMDIICILWKYPRSVDIIRISWIYPYFVDIYIYIPNQPPYPLIILIFGWWSSNPGAEARGALGSVPNMTFDTVSSPLI